MSEFLEKGFLIELIIVCVLSLLFGMALGKFHNYMGRDKAKDKMDHDDSDWFSYI